MPSINSSDVLLQLDALQLSFQTQYYQQRTLRDVFVRWARAPWTILSWPSESLHVLSGINLTLRRGDRLGLLGVNGSGKTTLCRCIAGMLVPTAGKVRLNGSCRAIYNTQVGIMPELTGRENAHLLARLIYPKLSSTDREKLVREALDFTELGSFLDTSVETYSQGMRARLSLSIMTARSCDVLILDEVADNTDYFFQQKMRKRLESFLHLAGAVIFVSHSYENLKNNCNRVAVLHEGKIAYSGEVATALRTYRFLNGAAPEEIAKETYASG